MQHSSIIEENTLNDPDLQNALKKFSGVQVDLEYQESIDPTPYVGWNTISSWDGIIRQLFTKKTVSVIRNKVSQYLDGVDPKGRKIIPSDHVILTALYGVYENHIPATGDIYGKFLVVDPTQRDDYSYIVDKTISLLVRGISTEVGMIEQNEKLNIWSATVLGDFNELGLRQYPPIKIKNKRPDPYLFNMKY